METLFGFGLFAVVLVACIAIGLSKQQAAPADTPTDPASAPAPSTPRTESEEYTRNLGSVLYWTLDVVARVLLVVALTVYLYDRYQLSQAAAKVEQELKRQQRGGPF